MYLSYKTQPPVKGSCNCCSVGSIIYQFIYYFVNLQKPNHLWSFSSRRWRHRSTWLRSPRRRVPWRPHRRRWAHTRWRPRCSRTMPALGRPVPQMIRQRSGHPVETERYVCGFVQVCMVKSFKCPEPVTPPHYPKLAEERGEGKSTRLFSLTH